MWFRQRRNISFLLPWHLVVFICDIKPVALLISKGFCALSSTLFFIFYFGYLNALSSFTHRHFSVGLVVRVNSLIQPAAWEWCIRGLSNVTGPQSFSEIPLHCVQKSFTVRHNSLSFVFWWNSCGSSRTDPCCSGDFPSRAEKMGRQGCSLTWGFAVCLSEWLMVVIWAGARETTPFIFSNWKNNTLLMWFCMEQHFSVKNSTARVTAGELHQSSL